MCVFLTCYDQLDPSACTEKVINLMKRALMPDWRHRCLCAGAGIHATNCLLIPKAMIWTCLSFLLLFLSSLCILTFLERSRGGSPVLLHHLFIAKTAGIGREGTLLHIYGIVFLSSEAIQTAGEQQEVPALRCWTDLLVLKRARVYECLFSVTGRMCSAHCCHTKTLAITSSLLSLLDCHDVNDGNSATILRLCSFSFFLSTWPRCCLPCLCQLLSYQEKPYKQ